MFTRLQEVRKSHGEKEFRAIHSQALLAAENLKRSEAEMIRALQTVDDKLVHRFLGYNSLYRYAVEALKLSEHQAYMYIAVGRKAKALPRLQAAIENKEITISKASRITAVINDANQQKWIGLAASLPKRELEREVATVNPRAVTPERVRFLSASVLQMEMPISEDGFKLIERSRDLMSSSKGKALSIEETVTELAQYFLRREDPLQKAERAEKRKQRKTTAEKKVQDTGTTIEPESERAPEAELERERVPENPIEDRIADQSPQTKPQSQKKPAHGTHPRVAFNSSLKHFINLRDGRKCTHTMPDGRRCGESRWIEIHHIIPVSQGGSNKPENLTTVCRAHHQMLHAPSGGQASSLLPFEGNEKNRVLH